MNEIQDGAVSCQKCAYGSSGCDLEFGYEICILLGPVYTSPWCVHTNMISFPRAQYMCQNFTSRGTVYYVLPV